MKYYIKSVIDYIAPQVAAIPQEGSRRFQVMIPSLPAQVTLALANRLTEYCLSKDIILVFKVARELAKEWTEQEQADLRENNYLASGSLTGLRNTLSQDESIILSVLVGSARVTDRGSLADFHQCDFNALWGLQLKRSFSGWLENFFNEHNLLFGDQEIKQADEIVKELASHYDLLKISSWLEHLSIDSSSASEAIHEMLTQLEVFGLPNLKNCIGRGRRKDSFPYYTISARDFFNYTAFIEPTKREDALKRIEAFVANPEKTVLPEQIAPFESEDEFFKALREYVTDNSENARKALKHCDFEFIWENVLKYKQKTDKLEKQSVKKLTGAPLEVFLHAVYLSLSKLQDYSISKIALTGIKFKHDYFADDSAQSDAAQKALTQLLGGIDTILERHIQIFLDEDGNTIEIVSSLLNDNIAFESSKTSEPYFEFRITIATEINPAQTFNFAFRLPEIHPHRLAANLLNLTDSALKEHNSEWLYPIPVFHLNYYQELMAAKDEEEICRILLHCINECRPGTAPFIDNLFTKTWHDDHPDHLKSDLEQIASKYKLFVASANEDGLYAALIDKGQDLINAFHLAAEHFVKDEQYQKSTKLAAMLFRAFLVVGNHKNEDIDTWGVKPFEKDAVVTILHPSLLEMLKAQSVFLLKAFSTLVNESLKSTRHPFKENRWQYYVDLAEIQMPLCGLLTNNDGVLNVDVRGKNLVHRILNKETSSSASIATRLMTRYDHIDEEDISDTEIFKETRESKLLLRILDEYRTMHPHAQDGISIAVYRNDDIQPVLSALNSFLKEHLSGIRAENSPKYSVSLVLFSDSADDTGVSNYLDEWQERWEAAENEEKLKYYSCCDLFISHRIVSSNDGWKHFEKILKDEFDCDIVVFYNFIAAGQNGNKFKEVAPYDSTQDTLKFPILEKSFCSQATPDEKLTRSQIISNRQFRINADHTEIMARLKNPYTKTNQYHVILGTGNFAEWQKVIDAAHEAAEWVVCIDPNIDDKLIAEINPHSYSAKRRELIGFGSGVGVHGESNYTISTQQFTFDNLRVNLRNNFRNTYSYGNEEDDARIVDELLKSAQKLSGLSIIRALGPSYYRCDFLAYSLIYKILPLAAEQHLCNQIFSIDAYHHWFDLSSAPDKTHPDLLWLRADINSSGKFVFNLKLIECKMRKENTGALDEAKEQIQNGLDVLVKAFKPKQNDNEVPDGRFWYLQLHRLIACSAKDIKHEDQFLAAMERLAAGDFEISWSAGVFAFWTDSMESTIKEVDCWSIESNGEFFDVPVYSVGYKFIRNLCSGTESPILSWDNNLVTLAAQTEDLSALEERSAQDEIAQPGDEDTILIEGKPEVEFIPDSEKHSEESLPDTQTQKSEQNAPTMIPEIPPAAVPPPVSGIPQRIFLGKEGEKDFYWEFGHNKLNNRHLLIFGSSGMGKTYAIQTILCELGRQSQNSLILDYTNGFLPNQLESEAASALHPCQRIVKNDKIPIDPFLRQKQDFGNGIVIENNSMDIAKRVAAIFNSVYNMGDQQMSILIDAIQAGVDAGSMSIEKLIPVLESFLDDGYHKKTTVQTLISKLKPFISEQPFTSDQNNSWSGIFADLESHCHIFQLAGVDKATSRILIEFILWDLYAFACNSSTEKTPKVVVLDEVQNLDQSLEAPLGKILTEGRKFGLCVIAATQTLSNLDKDQQARLFQAGHKLFFGPNAPEANQYADLVMQVAGSGTREQWKTKLMGLQKGECLSIGPVLNERTGEIRTEVHKIKISSLAERGF